jgi:uncharacterized protein YegJ (DUF2314 family)
MSIYLVNAEERTRKFPRTFKRPHRKKTKNLKILDRVKVCSEGEHFWVLILEILADGSFKGTIDNDLITNKLRYGQIIFLKKEHIFDIEKNG